MKKKTTTKSAIFLKQIEYPYDSPEHKTVRYRINVHPNGNFSSTIKST